MARFDNEIRIVSEMLAKTGIVPQVSARATCVVRRTRESKFKGIA